MRFLGSVGPLDLYVVTKMNLYLVTSTVWNKGKCDEEIQNNTPYLIFEPKYEFSLQMY